MIYRARPPVTTHERIPFSRSNNTQSNCPPYMQGQKNVPPIERKPFFVLRPNAESPPLYTRSCHAPLKPKKSSSVTRSRPNQEQVAPTNLPKDIQPHNNHSQQLQKQSMQPPRYMRELNRGLPAKLPWVHPGRDKSVLPRRVKKGEVKSSQDLLKAHIH